MTSPRTQRRFLWAVAGFAAAWLCHDAAMAQYAERPLENKQGRCGRAKAGHERHSHPGVLDGHEASRAFDMLHYSLDLVLPMMTDELQGTCTMSLLVKSPLDAITLHAVGLSFDTVRVDGMPKPVTVDPETEAFTIHLQETRSAGETLTIFVPYVRRPGFQRLSGRQGYYHFSTDSVPGLPSNLGYTLSEPSDTRLWMPCFDEPWDKATAEINVTVPAGYVAASNGRLVSVTEHDDDTRTWHWREDHQIAPYLLCATVSIFSIARLPYVTAHGDTIPVEYYVWNSGIFEDSSTAASYLPTVRSMLAAYAGAFGEYPFDKYGMTSIVPFELGGMEHQTMSTLNRYLFTDEQIVAHELAHQWWGDLVTCATWPDIWLNESFATYSEAIWHESRGGHAALRAYMRDSLEQFQFLSWTGAVYDPVAQGFDLFDRVVYSKGAWVLHTLRGVIGDSAFFQVLRSYRSAFEEANATTGDFMAVVDSVTGRDYRSFFDQWIFGRGWPQYALRYSWQGDTLALSLSQQQNVSWPRYTMPLTLRAYHAGDSTTFLVWDSLRTQHFTFHLPVPPDSVILDPDGWVLKQIVPFSTAVPGDDEPRRFSLLQNYPNPFNPTTEMRFEISDVRFVRLVVYDLLGREVAVLVNEKKAPGSYSVRFTAADAPGLASGVYFYRLTAGPYGETRKMLLLQ